MEILHVISVLVKKKMYVIYKYHIYKYVFVLRLSKRHGSDIHINTQTHVIVVQITFTMNDDCREFLLLHVEILHFSISPAIYCAEIVISGMCYFRARRKNGKNSILKSLTYFFFFFFVNPNTYLFHSLLRIGKHSEIANEMQFRVN